jgi:hypothetical protein
MEELMPFLLEQILMLKYCRLDAPQFGRAYVAASGESDRFQPKLAFSFARVHMDMRRLHSFIGIKMETLV